MIGFDKPHHRVFGLYVDGKTFLGTFKSESREMAERMAKARGGSLRDYGVKIKRVNPSTKETLEWDKVDGISVWK